MVSLEDMNGMHPVDAMKRFCRQHKYWPAVTNGRVGVVRGQHLITSPNVDYVPDPQLGNSCVRMRADFRFGIDDCTQWPQWFHNALPHLPCIPRWSKALAPMWWIPTLERNFTRRTDIEDARVGRIIGEPMRTIEKMKRDLLLEGERIMKEIEAEKGEKRYAVLIPGLGASTAYLRHGWLQLQGVAAGFDEKRLELVEVQRAWLEVKGMTNYYRWKRSRYDRGCAVPSGPPESCMGCFVENPTTAHMYWTMGVPVWLVWMKLEAYQAEIHIQAPTEMTTHPSSPSQGIELEVLPNFPTIYTGNPKLPEHHECQQNHARIRLSIPSHTPSGNIYTPANRRRLDREAASTVCRTMAEVQADMFTEASVLPSSLTSTLGASLFTPSTSTSTQSSRYAPYNRSMRKVRCKVPAHQAVAPPPQQLLDSIFSPSQIQTWTLAAASVSKAVPAHLQMPLSFAFPSPSIFSAGFEHPRSKVYFRNWLHLRRGWLEIITSGERGTLALKTQTWKDILWFGYGGPAPDPHPDCARLRNDLELYNATPGADGSIIFYEGVEKRELRLCTPLDRIGEAHIEKVQFLGKPGESDLRTMSPEKLNELRREVLWELQELNFRFDLMRLDKLLCPPENEGRIGQRNLALADCWEDGRADDLCRIVRDGRRNTGLAADTIRERLPYLGALFKLCERWRNISLPQALQQLANPNQALRDDDAQALEATLIKVLTECSYTTFTRTLTPPARVYAIAIA